MAQVGFDGLFSINYTFRRNDLDIYSNGIRNYNIRYRQHQADFVPFNYKLKKYTIQVGIRWDYYDYYGRLLSLNGSTFDTEDDHYFSYRLEANLNTENRWYFPSKGQRVHIGYAYRTTNLVQFKNDFGLSDIIVHWRINIPLTPRLTLQPMIYGRCLLGKDIPFAFRNALGNETFSHYIEQQLPFAGIGNVEYIDNQIVALHAELAKATMYLFAEQRPQQPPTRKIYCNCPTSTVYRLATVTCHSLAPSTFVSDGRLVPARPTSTLISGTSFKEVRALSLSPLLRHHLGNQHAATQSHLCR